MKSVSQHVGPNDAQKKPNIQVQMNNPLMEVQNVIPNVAKPGKMFFNFFLLGNILRYRATSPYEIMKRLFD